MFPGFFNIYLDFMFNRPIMINNDRLLYDLINNNILMKNTILILDEMQNYYYHNYDNQKQICENYNCFHITWIKKEFMEFAEENKYRYIFMDT